MCKFGELHYQPPRHSQALITKSGQLHFRVDSHCDNNYVVLLFLSFHPKSTKIAAPLLFEPSISKDFRPVGSRSGGRDTAMESNTDTQYE